jgi:hypothetical protein
MCKERQDEQSNDRSDHKLFEDVVLIPEEEVEIRGSGGMVLKGNARTVLRLFPSPRVLALSNDLERAPTPCALIEADEWMGRWVTRGARAKMSMQSQDITHIAFGSFLEKDESLPDHEFRINESTEWKTEGANKLVEVSFYLMNFPVFLYSECIGKCRNAYGKDAAIPVCVSPEWEITLSHLPDAKATPKALRRIGGWTRTHKGSIRRPNSETFAANQAKEAIGALLRYLSFVRGGWSSPSLPVGTDGKGVETWRQFLIGAISEQRTVLPNWWGTRCGASLPIVFSGFWKLWTDRAIRDHLSRCIYWYVTSNSDGNVDSGLMVAQAGLELAYWIAAQSNLVQELDSNGTKTPADVRIRTMLAEMGIRCEIPSRYSSLHKQLKQVSKRADCDGGDERDGPRVITAIRNSLVHPAPKWKPVRNATQDAWILSLHYLELTLLKLFEYNGPYFNRLKHTTTGEAELVPWIADKNDEGEAPK